VELGLDVVEIKERVEVGWGLEGIDIGGVVRYGVEVGVEIGEMMVGFGWGWSWDEVGKGEGVGMGYRMDGVWMGLGKWDLGWGLAGWMGYGWGWDGVGMGLG